MFAPTWNESKCKTNLKLAIERMKLLQKKKEENATKSRNEISNYIRCKKIERARIKVEHLIREDYTVEAIELIEQFCDLLLARFPLFARSKQIDPAVEEAVSSIIWAGPRLESEIPEIKKIIISVTTKLGKTFIEECTCNKLQTVNEKLIQRLSVEAPSRALVERYLVEIASSHGLKYEPDPVIMLQDRQWNLGQQYLINLDNTNSTNGTNASDLNNLDKWCKAVTEPPVSPPPPFWPTIYPSAPFMSNCSDQNERTAFTGSVGFDEDLQQKRDLTSQSDNTLRLQGNRQANEPTDKTLVDQDYDKASEWFAKDNTASPMPAISSLDLPDVPDDKLSPTSLNNKSTSVSKPSGPPPKLYGTNNLTSKTNVNGSAPHADFDDLNRRFNDLRNRK